MRDSGSWRGGWLDRRFAIGASGSTPSREAIAGVTTFAAMMYIIAVNPAVMGTAVMDRGDVASATMIVAIFGCVLMGLWANLPIGLAPSMGSNAFFAFVMVGKMGLSWQASLAVILCAGVLMLALSLSGVREALVGAVPEELKTGLQAAFGLFILSIALRQVGVWPDMSPGPPAWLAAGGLLVTLVLMRLGVPGALVLSILATTLVGTLVPAGDGQVTTALPASLVAWPRWPQETFLALDAGYFVGHPLKALIAILFVTFSECVGLLATTVTVTRMAGLDRGDGVMPGARAAFASDASATVLGALLGTATVSPYVESVAGVRAGGRTGLTALVAAIGFAAALFFWPVLGAVPAAATAPALGVIGLAMIRHGIAGIDRRDARSILPVLSMFVTTLATLNLIDALAVGGFVYLLTRIGRGGVQWSARVLCTLFLMLWIATVLLT